MKNTILHMKINEGLKERLRKLAEQDGRTLSNLIQNVLTHYTDRKEGERSSPRGPSLP